MCQLLEEAIDLKLKVQKLNEAKELQSMIKKIALMDKTDSYQLLDSLPERQKSAVK